MKKPYSKINVEITNICNLQCHFCPEVIRPKGLMDLELFRKIVTEAAPLTEQICLHLMGDPLLHPKLETFLDLCGEKGVRVFFVTNAVLLREPQFRILLHPALRQVNFSLHSFFANFPDGDCAQYLNNIFSYTERAFTERPDLYINYRVWDLAKVRGESPKQVEILDRIEARFGIVIHRNPDVGRHKGRVLKNRLYLHFDTQFIWPDLSLPTLGEAGTCYGLSNHFGVLVDGTVVPCCLDKEGVIPLGNIEKNSLVDILDAPRSRAMLKGFQQGRLVEELCRRCQYIERFTKNVAVSR